MSQHNTPCNDKNKSNCSTPKANANKSSTRDVSDKMRGNISQDRQRNQQNEKHHGK